MTPSPLRWIRFALASGALCLACASGGTATTAAPRASTSSQVRQGSACNDWEIYFASNSAEVSPQTRAALVELAQCLQRGEVREVTVLGSADPRGSEMSNSDLAQRRADAIRDVLVANGCPPSVVGAQTVGEQGTSGSARTYPSERRAVIHAHDVATD
jgi:outer membrane protein OmpA-like peptidoglycan-associated protein